MKPWLGDSELNVGGRNQTKLFDGLTKQVALISPVVAKVRRTR